MGCKNRMAVLDDADLEVAVECAVRSAFFSTGQRCTASSRHIVEEGNAVPSRTAHLDAIRSGLPGAADDPSSIQ
ncbi:hypothetical protein RM96_03595 [Cupriavidus sp. IDO]|nr:hypothetical protein RM96_03595 [Cupriavidus sp. IDO]